jgi:hypothetical protein
MTLYQKLQQAKTEEDVKDAYIKALGLKGYSKNLIDIQTKEIWFEAKNNSTVSSYAMFTQLMHYVQVALNTGEPVPPFLAVIDTKKAAIMKSEDVIPFLAKKRLSGVKVLAAIHKKHLTQSLLILAPTLYPLRLKTAKKNLSRQLKMRSKMATSSAHRSRPTT